MSNQENEQQQSAVQQVKLEDLPVEESTTEQVKGGPVNGITDKPSG